jgi:4-hydroxymandelate oxidase
VSAKPCNVDDVEALAREKLPQWVYDFIAGGTEDELTLRANRDAFQRLVLLPRVLIDVGHIDTTTDVLGHVLRMPVLLAPAGSQRVMHPEGEIASARSAADFGTVFTLSSTATSSIEEVAEASNGPKWFQLYMIGGRPVAERLVQRAEEAGYQAVCLTVDSARHSKRERDIRNQPPFQAEMAPRNFEGLLDYSQIAHNARVTWEDVDWLCSITSMPIVLKGIVRPDDALRAVEHGIRGIVVSNHGGRQLDGTIATIDALPDIVGAVNGRTEVLLDGGVRRGTDILKALALGAQAVLVGRAYLWGLAAAGQHGVSDVLELLRYELEIAMALAGCPTIADIDASMVRR